jgi:hypothetical protein
MYAAMSTPVLLLAFNRPDLFLELINCIRETAPKNIYVAIDGPRESNANDAQDVFDTVSLITNIDWECNLRVLKQRSNLGCGHAVSSAISWVFEHEEMVIILEDDIRPNSSFFQFCEEMLQQYKNDERIMTVSGHSMIEVPNSRINHRLSKYPVIWGWATWKRSWTLYEYSLDSYPKIGFVQLLKAYRGNLILSLQCVLNFRAVRSNRIDTWDYQLVYSSFLYSKFHVIPNVNLTENVGFDQKATHTKFPTIPSPKTKEIGNFQSHKLTNCSPKSERRDRSILQKQLFQSLRAYSTFRMSSILSKYPRKLIKSSP